MPCHDADFVDLHAAGCMYPCSCDARSVTPEPPGTDLVLQGLSHGCTEGLERVHNLNFVRMRSAHSRKKWRVGSGGEVHARREPCPVPGGKVIWAEEVLQPTKARPGSGDTECHMARF